MIASVTSALSMAAIQANLPLIAIAVLLLTVAAYAIVSSPTLKGILVFTYNCFLKPIDKSNSSQQVALESFYKGQANIYDNTRGRLLKGRELVLRLCGSHMNTTQNPVWIDVSKSNKKWFNICHQV